MSNVASVAQFGQWQYPIWKHQDDLDRYQAIIDATHPDVVIEAGTNTGEMAVWFADRVRHVYTIDIDHKVSHPTKILANNRVTWLGGSSINPSVIQMVAELVKGKRVMVSLDSDHSRHHVVAEIDAYAPLVTPGCYLVIEDGIIAYLDGATKRAHACAYQGNVIEAIGDRYEDLSREFVRDTELEEMTQVTMHPCGWWRRK